MEGVFSRRVSVCVRKIEIIMHFQFCQFYVPSLFLAPFITLYFMLDIQLKEGESGGFVSA